MNPIDLADVTRYVEDNIASFHARRIQKLMGLSLRDILKRKNPYLFKARNILSAEALVKGLLEAYLSSQEETLFGEFLEGLAIFICQRVYGGWKSTAEGIDLEFDRDGIRYIVSIKSGPNWGNSSQVNKLKDNFRKAKRILRGANPQLSVQAVNGCCYGYDSSPDKEEYYKYCGQRFWAFISGNEALYLQIIEPLGHQAKERNAVFESEYYRIVNKFTHEFADDFCDDGRINWEALVAYNSGAQR